jgi:hypothetical protein
VTIEEDVSIGASDDTIELSITDDDSMGASEDIMELSIDDESIGISEDIAEESIADDSIEDIDESIMDDDSMDEEASWAITGSARTAATAVVASRVRIIVSSLGSTLVLDNRAARYLAGFRRRAVLIGPTLLAATCSAFSGFPSKLPQGLPRP